MERRSIDTLRRAIAERERLIDSCRRCGEQNLVTLLARELAQLRRQLEAVLLPEKFGRRAVDRQSPPSNRKWLSS